MDGVLDGNSLLAARPFSFPSFLQMMAGTIAGVTVRYLIFAGIAWLLAYVWFKRQWFHRKIISRAPQSAEVWREVRYSAISVIVFGILGALTIHAASNGWTQMYWRLGQRGQGWFWVSIASAIVLHDAYFYWTHRLMHHRLLFRAFHRAHHLSHNPTPWAAYAFSPLEAAVQGAIFPLIVFTIPIHPGAFAIFMVWQIAFNIAGHAGFEFLPRRLMDSPLRHLLNTPTNHIMHHEKMRGNYGLYFNVWDRLFGTNHDDYEKRFREVTGRPSPIAQREPGQSAPKPARVPD